MLCTRELISSLSKLSCCLAPRLLARIQAFHIGGGTIHSFSGVGLAEGPHEQIVQRVMANKNLVSKWRDAECLIVDEVSMMDADFFELLNEVAQVPSPAHTLPLIL